jgi:hypothetical protein
MSELNKKNGNLRGVKLSYSPNEDDWTFNHPVQGWVVSGGKKNSHRFLLNVHIDGRAFEISLTRDALDNMVYAIAEADEPALFAGNYFPSAWFGSSQTDTTGI